jgi:hypothetical protein
MTAISELQPWATETPGERLFLAAYELVRADVPHLFSERSWVVSSTGLSEFFRLIAAMELTHRCINAVAELLRANSSASAEAVLRLLRTSVEIYGSGATARLFAEESRLSALAYLNDSITEKRADKVHRDSGKLCCWCGNTLSRAQSTPKGSKATIEHLWPTFLGGTSDVSNVTIACDHCNNARQHAFSWAWFGLQGFNEQLDSNNRLPRNVLLSLALHRLIRVASGQTRVSRTPVSLKTATQMLNVAMPKIRMTPGKRYTFFELLQLAED